MPLEQAGMTQDRVDYEPQVLIENWQLQQLQRTIDALKKKNGSLLVELNEKSLSLIQRRKQEEELFEQVTTLTMALGESKAVKANIVPNSSVKTPRECRHASRGNGSDPIAMPMKSKQKRKRIRFTSKEDACLRTGVEQHRTSWVAIRHYGDLVFHPRRTTVDLKDRWRNLKRQR